MNKDPIDNKLKKVFKPFFNLHSSHSQIFTFNNMCLIKLYFKFKNCVHFYKLSKYRLLKCI